MKKLFSLALLVASSHSLWATVFPIANGNVAALAAAITTANTNRQADIINLAPNGTYVFTTINNTVAGYPPGYIETEGPVALPVILHEPGNGVDLIINLNGAVLRLSSTAPKMRLLQSGSDVSWQLNGGTIKDFESPMNNPVAGHGGGGGAVVSGQRNVFSSEFMTFDNCTSRSREERSGGAISFGGGRFILKNSTYKNNTGSTYGGAVTALFSDVRIENCRFENNRCTIGGGAAVYVDGCTGSRTTPGGLGEIIGCTFVNNNSPSFGAVFLQGYNEDQWVVRNCQFTNNKATGTADGSQGGALFHNTLNNGTLEVSNSTFENNEAKNYGGAVVCGRGTNRFTNCTFYANKTTVPTYALGGALYGFTNPAGGETGFVAITNCTFADNIAGGYGGAWSILGNQGSVKNTIIANNRAYQQCGYPPPAGCVGSNNANNCGVTLIDNGNNIEYPERPKYVAGIADPNDRPCFPRPVVVNSNMMPVINPRLSPPANNGGPTRTMALQAGSPAIDAGNGCPATDQRGTPRVGACDIGAFEYGAVLATTPAPAPEALGLYPNPSPGEVFLTLPANRPAGPLHVRLYALDGRLVFEQTLESAQPARLLVPVKGLFLVKATIGQQVFVQKLATY
ncbi:T9SS type A sorting domain-containing protein [Hymenobacter sp. BT664]|uniref:T9SS type A sorting domain-containing protein n=1 Tax=Hymenobacter montanus TaxID=2771359 RepID=A0A927BF69_9BACT|nr:T9SS type A sorting domain-containing protein [Hymenobacter montanus]MBD2768944.1 T9SS type A sorting domain-containing protein [Hymenobacter montanus]